MLLLFSPTKKSYSWPLGASGVAKLFDSSPTLLEIVLEFFKGRFFSAVFFHSSNCSYVIALFYMNMRKIQLVMDTMIVGLP